MNPNANEHPDDGESPARGAIPAPRGERRPARLALALLALACALPTGCGGASGDGGAGADAAAAPPSAKAGPSTAEFDSLRKEVAQLGEHVARLERENHAQLARIKESLTRVEGAIGAVRASGPSPGASGESGAAAAGSAASRGIRNLAIQFVLLGVIVGAIFFILRLFFGRWGAEGGVPSAAVAASGAPASAASPASAPIPPVEDTDTPIQTEPIRVPPAVADDELDDDDPIPSPLETKKP